jgi:S-adenosylmethionine synthetase
MPYLFTSESVSEGHPDKVADQISDALLDAFLRQDPASRVAIETLVTTGLVVTSGEVRSDCYVDVQDVARGVIRTIGYTDPSLRFDAESCGVLSSIHGQSPEIAQGVDEGDGKSLGAGDQGLMFGYACRETEELMPLPLSLAHGLMRELARIRKSEPALMPFLRPDSKAQVTVEYEDDRRTPRRVDTVVVSTQHHPEATQERIREAVLEHLLPRVLPEGLWDPETLTLHVNPTGRFVIGGPHGDAGLTGRKIIVDTYGGKGAHGGGAFSGKDPTKVDRSAAYAARHVAKNLVGAGLAEEVLVQVAYAIGVAEPVSIDVNTHGTGAVDDRILVRAVRECFDLTPRGIIDRLALLDTDRVSYLDTAAYGHFGRDEFPWEALDAVDDIKRVAERHG